LSIISQGIAARYARRQASSAAAHIHQQIFPLFGELARGVLADAGYVVEAGDANTAEQKAEKAKL
jgi:hypothetical protein